MGDWYEIGITLGIGLGAGIAFAGVLAGLRFGGAYLVLQDIDVPEWQKNPMITFEVDALGAY